MTVTSRHTPRRGALKDQGKLDMLAMTLKLLDETFAIARLDSRAPVPAWATQSRFHSVTRIGSELSIVCPEGNLPSDVLAVKGWRCLGVEGPLDFQLTGVLASLAGPLADGGISLFAISTYETDYLLVKQESLAAAIDALRSAGHSIVDG